MTVDWVVLTAAIVGLAIAAGNSVFVGAEGLGTTTSAALQGQVVVLGDLGYSN